MDKNIKAELSSLKTEIINGLNGIEKLILSLDSKIEPKTEYDNSIQYLVDPHRKHVDDMKDILDRLHNVENVVQNQELNTFIDDLKRLSGAGVPVPDSMIDKIINYIPPKLDGSLPSTERDCILSVSSKVNLDDIPEIVERNKDKIVWTNDTAVKSKEIIESIADKMADSSIPETFNYPIDSNNLKIRETKSTEYKPEWLNDVDKKSISQVMGEAMKWDGYSQEVFINEWNNNFKKRYDIIKSKLDTFLLIVKNHKRPIAEVKSIEDAQQVIKEFEKFEKLRNDIIKLIDQNLLVNLFTLSESKEDDKFVKYYNCLNQLADDIRALELDASEPTPDRYCVSVEFEFLRVLQTQYRNLLEDHEIDMYEMIIIDPNTFKPMKIPANKQTAYKKLQYANYKKDLSNAYKWLSKDTIVIR